MVLALARRREGKLEPGCKTDLWRADLRKRYRNLWGAGLRRKEWHSRYHLVSDHLGMRAEGTLKWWSSHTRPAQAAAWAVHLSHTKRRRRLPQRVVHEM
eukprot:COSAG02_NODE_1200_length_13909_cov_15.541202_11_plen_99_part_00